MKQGLLTVKELAAELRMSLKSIRKLPENLQAQHPADVR